MAATGRIIAIAGTSGRNQLETDEGLWLGGKKASGGRFAGAQNAWCARAVIIPVSRRYAVIARAKCHLK